MKIMLINVLILFSLCFTGIDNCFANTFDVNLNDKKIFLLDNELGQPSVDKNCNALGGFKDDLQSIFNAFKIVAPILTLVLSSFEYMTSITSKDGEGLKKANKRLINRIILVAILFFLPIILNVIIDLMFPGSGVCVS